MNNTLIKGKNIAIIGGGPGGLVLARLLQMKGVTVKVFERDLDKNVRQQGATLDLHNESGLKALQDAGLMEEFIEHYRPNADLLRIVDRKGNILTDQHTTLRDDTVTFGHAHFRPEIDRGPLRNILIDSLLPETIIWNSQFVNMEPSGDGWQISFKNGNSVFADIVIGADGANSKIRPYMTDIKPFYSGITVIEGLIHDSAEKAPEIHALVKEGKVFAFGNDQSIILSSKGDGSIAFYFGFKAAESWTKTCSVDFTDREQLLLWFKEEYSNWDGIWDGMITSAENSFIPRPQYCMPFDQNWKAGANITMLGDAAHLMPPYAGEGVNMAMLDALELSQCLSNEGFDDLQTAIAFYEKQMRTRASEVAMITMESTAMLHSDEAISFMTDVLS
ncbi:NAD(P)/FAD-dependent oxidoreductase [Pedobacter antarcticus]|uniref:FAD-dependent oxidoreductase n=1 Tax=Pedobacter antarcticus TaxID=34086 RepID=UPI00292F136E|nr:NAD(P)/FAD-dependent oxidoreductase [Pedobacter antarcticus]